MIRRCTLVFSLALGLLVFLTACEELESYEPGLTEAEITRGLKQALEVGTDTAVSRLAITDGFYKDQVVKILFPKEFRQVTEILTNVPGGDALVEEFVRKMNRAAEDAAPKAKPIFVHAITSITISDANGILQGTDTAATNYLKGKTQDSLQAVFYTPIDSSMASVGADVAWEELTKAYNSAVVLLPNYDPVNTDITDYVTEKALDGVFFKVGEEEKRIREDPLHRVTELLEKVFAAQDEE